MSNKINANELLRLQQVEAVKEALLTLTKEDLIASVYEPSLVADVSETMSSDLKILLKSRNEFDDKSVRYKTNHILKLFIKYQAEMKGYIHNEDDLMLFSEKCEDFESAIQFTLANLENALTAANDNNPVMGKILNIRAMVRYSINLDYSWAEKIFTQTGVGRKNISSYIPEIFLETERLLDFYRKTYFDNKKEVCNSTQIDFALKQLQSVMDNYTVVIDN